MYINIGKDTYLVEKNMPGTTAKSYGNKNTNSDEKEILVTFSKGLNPTPDLKAYDDAKDKYDEFKKEFGKEMQDLLTRYVAGKITKNQFKNSARKKFKSAYETAFEFGTEATGLNLNYFKLPDEDYRWLNKVRRAEYKYFDKFVDDITLKIGEMDYGIRLNMYVDFLDSLFDAGMVDAMPSAGTNIDWKMNPSEHCEGCILLAAGSPYTPDTLPTTPKAGDTRCLANCKCKLEISYKPPVQADMRVSKVNKPDGVDSIDWNSINEMMSLLMEEKLLWPGEAKFHKRYSTNDMVACPDYIKYQKKQSDLFFRHGEIKIKTDRAQELEEKFYILVEQISIDPDSRDFVLLHRLGDYIKSLNL